MVGLALVLRDLVQRRLGVAWTVVAILAGALLSGLFADPSLVYASVAAFVLSEIGDFAVFTPLQRRGLVVAVVLSSLVGLIVDSLVFLWLAFGSLDFLLGQVLGKTIMVGLSIPLIAWLRSRGRADTYFDCSEGSLHTGHNRCVTGAQLPGPYLTSSAVVEFLQPVAGRGDRRPGGAA
jgi:hypothetical protein